jgi:hypothetical protein
VRSSRRRPAAGCGGRDADRKRPQREHEHGEKRDRHRAMVRFGVSLLWIPRDAGEVATQS